MASTASPSPSIARPSCATRWIPVPVPSSCTSGIRSNTSTGTPLRVRPIAVLSPPIPPPITSTLLSLIYASTDRDPRVLVARRYQSELAAAEQRQQRALLGGRGRLRGQDCRVWPR